jgi:hypothetical protein
VSQRSQRSRSADKLAFSESSQAIKMIPKIVSNVVVPQLPKSDYKLARIASEKSTHSQAFSINNRENIHPNLAPQNGTRFSG